MAFQHKMQRNRFEFKYLIDERCAHDVRNFARSHLVRDEFARAEMKWAYPTHSVYLDGPGLPLYQATVQGHKNRYKLRLRYYSEAESAPVFFEIKRRISDIVLKDRALVKRDRALRIMAGERPRVTRSRCLVFIAALLRYARQPRRHTAGICIVLARGLGEIER